MGLFEQISADIKAAMLAKEKTKLEALRAIKSALLLARTEKGGSDDISEEKGIQLLNKLVKQRKDAAQMYKDNSREEACEKELFEAEVIMKYLPEQISQEELNKVLSEIITKVGASNPSEMGKVMGVASKQLAGKADGKLIAETVRTLLSK